MGEEPLVAAPPVLRVSRAETRFLFVANAGPKLGDGPDVLRRVFSAFGEVDGVAVPDPDIAQCLVAMRDVECARAARDATHKQPCPQLNNRELWVTFAHDPDDASKVRSGKRSTKDGVFIPDAGEVRIAAARAKQEAEMCVAVTSSSLLQVPGATLLHEFVTPEEELEILELIDSPDVQWQRLAKRRVAHFGYAFDYSTRDARTFSENPLPPICKTILHRLSSHTEVSGSERALFCDQLTVNEYPAGVGLAPHVDTHSAFGAAIFSLSLAGNSVMEFRKLEEVDREVDRECSGVDGQSSGTVETSTSTSTSTSVTVTQRAAIALPERSMLALTKNARYEWQHYIPHRKRDVVSRGEEEHIKSSDKTVYTELYSHIRERAPRRVSLTFRERRDNSVHGLCRCHWPAACDSRQGIAQRLKQRARPGLVAKADRKDTLDRKDGVSNNPT